MIPRSYLYVPGDRTDRLDAALRSGTDAVILDLEDSVAEPAKASARLAVRAVLDSGPGTSRHGAANGVELWVRINPGEAGTVDLAALAGAPNLCGICPAKTRSMADLDRMVSLLGDAPEPSVLFEPLLEDAVAVLAAREIATHRRVRRLHLGEGDLAADLRLTGGDPEAGLLGARHAVVLASAAAGVQSPVAPASTDYRDLATFRRTTLQLAALGFWGRACIHPAQVEVANEVFSPSAEQVAWARDVLSALERAEASGSGVAVDGSGRMVDEAIARRARLVLERMP